ncbi:peptide-methionine (S)-S-oxide reductase MsrA [Candidatus Uhrbacteria bacterium]|nr:peptide-methionine (S)-S-oxide reductase MsrA [Candidatus Uhrbacteria bacterium]
MSVETIVFGGGCFWCTEAIFQRLKGVVSVLPGYAGGATSAPSYEQVSSGCTGHAEVIQVMYDPSVISVDDLFSVFFATHDPTSLNRQGHDVGTQYRSAIFVTTEPQRAAAERYIQRLNDSTSKGQPIVTEVMMLDQFYPAEQYHVDYYNKNKGDGYCQLVIEPKLEHARKEFARLMKEQG